MKRQRNILNFLRKIPRTESSVEEATEIATDDIQWWIFQFRGPRQEFSKIDVV